MKKSISLDYEMENPGFDDFDIGLNFSKFLEEAKHHATQQHFKAASIEEETERKWLAQEKKNKKSWKNTLFSWLKSDKKSKSLPKPEKNPHTPNKRRVYVSGPIYSEAMTIDGRPRRRPMSGPIASLFNPTMRTETEIPYMCLHQLSAPNTNQNYGPIYLVT
ncbi:uncharacterized protein LOC101209455 [Cucumis sativus]|uniref:Uncharacterized protein n=1 Tax=Cucumis sativus TaxID=3659 RepID=A0A0A0LC20_CUCSA|nr:uncharacterized protein LOC101209455 [Cucumis sativus]KGN58479.1 hypothetical protein Csa_002575 [Cucumis sativus]